MNSKEKTKNKLAALNLNYSINTKLTSKKIFVEFPFLHCSRISKNLLKILFFNVLFINILSSLESPLPECKESSPKTNHSLTESDTPQKISEIEIFLMKIFSVCSPDENFKDSLKIRKKIFSIINNIIVESARKIPDGSIEPINADKVFKDLESIMNTGAFKDFFTNDYLKKFVILCILIEYNSLKRNDNSTNNLNILISCNAFLQYFKTDLEIDNGFIKKKCVETFEYIEKFENDLQFYSTLSSLEFYKIKLLLFWIAHEIKILQIELHSKNMEDLIEKSKVDIFKIHQLFLCLEMECDKVLNYVGTISFFQIKGYIQIQRRFQDFLYIPYSIKKDLLNAQIENCSTITSAEISEYFLLNSKQMVRILVLVDFEIYFLYSSIFILYQENSPFETVKSLKKMLLSFKNEPSQLLTKLSILKKFRSKVSCHITGISVDLEIHLQDENMINLQRVFSCIFKLENKPTISRIIEIQQPNYYKTQLHYFQYIRLKLVLSHLSISKFHFSVFYNLGKVQKEKRLIDMLKDLHFNRVKMSLSDSYDKEYELHCNFFNENFNNIANLPNQFHNTNEPFVVKELNCLFFHLLRGLVDDCFNQNTNYDIFFNFFESEFFSTQNLFAHNKIETENKCELSGNNEKNKEERNENIMEVTCSNSGVNQDTWNKFSSHNFQIQEIIYLSLYYEQHSATRYIKKVNRNCTDEDILFYCSLECISSYLLVEHEKSKDTREKSSAIMKDKIENFFSSLQTYEGGKYKNYFKELNNKFISFKEKFDKITNDNRGNIAEKEKILMQEYEEVKNKFLNNLEGNKNKITIFFKNIKDIEITEPLEDTVKKWHGENTELINKLMTINDTGSYFGHNFETDTRALTKKLETNSKDLFMALSTFAKSHKSNILNEIKHKDLILDIENLEKMRSKIVKEALFNMKVNISESFSVGFKDAIKKLFREFNENFIPKTSLITTIFDNKLVEILNNGKKDNIEIFDKKTNNILLEKAIFLLFNIFSGCLIQFETTFYEFMINNQEQV